MHLIMAISGCMCTQQTTIKQPIFIELTEYDEEQGVCVP